MKYALDTEFIDTPTASELISLGLVAEDGRELYFEFEFLAANLTPWLRENVFPHLNGTYLYAKAEAADEIRQFIGLDYPAFFCFFGAYDWYWFCRLFGGLHNLPPNWPKRYRELADIAHPLEYGKEHNALDDAHGIMKAVKELSKEFLKKK